MPDKNIHGKRKRLAVVVGYDYLDFDLERRQLEKLGLNLKVTQCKNKKELIRAARKAKVILGQWFHTRVTKEVIKELEECEVIANYTTGYDKVDIEAATAKGIAVIFPPSYCTEEVANHTIGLLLLCKKQLYKYINSVKAGYWDWKIGRPIKRFSEQILGLFGFGRIARSVAHRAQALGLTVIAVDPYLEDDVFSDLGVHRVGFEELLEKSDVISIHAPLTEETKGRFGRREFEKMKDSACIINVSRGEIINENDLFSALREGEIEAAGLDVMEHEPPDEQNPLLSCDNVIITPHAAWYSDQAYLENKKTIMRDVRRALLGKMPNGLVNREVEDKFSKGRYKEG